MHRAASLHHQLNDSSLTKLEQDLLQINTITTFSSGDLAYLNTLTCRLPRLPRVGAN